VNLGGRLTKGYLLTQILDPNGSIAPGYEEYIIETAEGGMVSGILAEDGATSVTLRRKEGHQDTVLRSPQFLLSRSLASFPSQAELTTPNLFLTH
jgi:putative heme-binding domain-containing protein